MECGWQGIAGTTDMIARHHLAFAAIPPVVVSGLALAFALRRPPPPPPPAPPPPEEVDAGPLATWCDPALEPLVGGGCFAAPREVASPIPLVIYLHGMYERAAAREELERQRRVAARATAKGFAVLALHGTEGGCKRPDLTTWFCWPSNERTAGDAPGVVAAWGPALDAATKRVGTGGKRFVLGFSNGAFFAGLLAVQALFPADAFAIAHGGPVEPVRARGPMPPLFLMSADDDESQDGMIRFDAELAPDKWPRDTYARGGGHALPEVDIDAALTFFTRSQREPVPLSPPITDHRPALHDRDASDAEPVSAAAIPDDTGDAIDTANTASTEREPGED
jgi:dienelactone hydrolase